MELYSGNNDYKLYYGNMLDLLEVIDKETIDSIITDPPYELNFMSKNWDNSGIAFQSDTWQKCYEVLKPGGYLLAFGGSRTFHRIACAIEDAGFEIRDTIMWLYGSGFPKSMDISKQIDKHLGAERKIIGKRTDGRYAYNFQDGNNQFTNAENNKRNFVNDKIGIITKPSTDLAKKWNGWGTALKPSFEPIIVARKPFKGSLVDNVIEYGVGGINIDECRVGMSDNDKEQYYNKQKSFNNMENKICGDNVKFNVSPLQSLEERTKNMNLGRFPANTILTYDETDFDEVCGGFPNTKSNKFSGKLHDIRKGSLIGSSKTLDINYEGGYEDSGSASRYFYCAKASKKDRDEGLEEFEEKVGGGMLGTQDQSLLTGSGNIRNNLRKNTHPTVKPTELMQYLVRLVSPNDATILDPFNGSGSTGKAVMYENRERNKNYKYIGIELTEEYLPIAKTRIEYVCNLPIEKDNQMTIFDFIEEE